MLYLMGIGLGNEKDLTLNAIDILKKCDLVYFENYTSNIGFEIKDLEKLIENKVRLVNRGFVENCEELIKGAKEKNIVLLIKGDVFSATTHSEIYLGATKAGVKCHVLHNSSVLTAIGDTGLSLYKFGKVISIPFNNENLNSPYEGFVLNGKLHTLFLLDLKPSENRYMNFKEALNYLLNKSKEKSDELVTLDSKAVVCASLGSDKEVIKFGKISDLLKLNIEVYPQCVIIPGELHFMEEEMLNCFKI